MLIENKRIMIIINPFINLDYSNKKKIIYLLKKIMKESNKTIIIGSNKSDEIYSICDKILLIKDNKWLYQDTIDVFSDKKILDEFNIEETDIIKFVRLAREKKINLNYTSDIRDLIKEVYKNV